MGGRGFIIIFLGKTLIPVLLSFHVNMFSAHVWIYVVLVYPMYNNLLHQSYGKHHLKIQMTVSNLNLFLYFHQIFAVILYYWSVIVCLCNNFRFILPVLLNFYQSSYSSFVVHFRVIPILPNLMPRYGSMTIYVNVSKSKISYTHIHVLVN